VAVTRQRRSWRPQQIGRLALQRPRKLIEPGRRYAGAGMFVVLDHLYCDADSLRQLALRHAAVLADLAQALGIGAW
jgi:hypothetical protein